MDTMISLRDMGYIMLVGAGFILLIYLIVLTANLIRTVKQTNKILEETEVITSIASTKTQEVDQIISGIGYSVDELSSIIGNNNSVVRAATNLINLGAAIKGLFTVAAKANGAEGSETAEEKENRES